MSMYIGKRLDGRYEIEKLIGMGGMANVYKAKDLAEDRTVAVKILREEFLENEDLVRRFKNESKAISQLNHPSIVRVFDVSVSDKVQYIAMEYIDGVTLKEYITERGVLTWKETLFFTEQVLDALQHAHGKGVTHRDIKPQNIMVLADGSIKVMDFGIARFARSEAHTVTDKAIGSVHYISPEQAKGDVIDNRADLYSAGVMMYEMLTGRLPFDSESAVQVAIKQISDMPDMPRSINPEIPEPLEAITMKAMAKDVRKRYQSAAEMEGAIEEFKKNPSIRFAYDYLDDDSPTRYIDKVVAKKTMKTEKKPGRPAKQPGENKAPAKKRIKIKKGMALPILAGLALAFAIGSLILCILIFNTSGLFSTTSDVELKNFVGMYYSEVKANQEFKENFKFDVEQVYSAEYPEGMIYSQNPNPPKQVKQGAKVTLWVSKGPEIVTVPSVSGQSRGEAQKTLSEMGLSVLIVSEENEKVEAGKVIRTQPEAGTKLETGNEITIYVSKAASSNTFVPPLVGVSSLAEARKLLDAAGLTLTPIEVEDTSPAGTILSQSPAAGTEVQVGSRVSVTVSKGFVTPTVKHVTVTVNFDKNVSQSHWVASVSGTVVSEYDSDGAGVWSFTIKGVNPQVLTITNGTTTKSTDVNFQTSPGISFNIAGSKPDPTPEPTETPEHSHSYSPSVTTAPTCDANGVMTYNCSCGSSYTEAIPATGHSNSVSETAPTCGADGSRTTTCTICGATSSETLPATGAHSFNESGVCGGCGATQ